MTPEVEVVVDNPYYDAVHDRLIAMDVNPDDCGSGMCDPNTGCPECNEDRRAWTRAR